MNLKLLKKNMSVKLDIGCGENKQKGFIGMDCRKLHGVDIVHNLEKFPYPLPDACCSMILGSHIIEHIKPEYSIPLLNELWRIMKIDGQLILSAPYPGSRGFWQYLQAKTLAYSRWLSVLAGQREHRGIDGKNQCEWKGEQCHYTKKHSPIERGCWSGSLTQG
jgi:SAM-dependent methyltransferase